MVRIFVSHAVEDTQCAEHIRQDLEAKGYTIWREPASLTLESTLYPRTIENVVLGSAAIILVWSSSAVQSEWVEQHILFTQRLKKLLLPVVIDSTNLQNTVIADVTISQAPCTNVVAQLLPHLPSPDSTDPLIKLYEQAAHEYIRIRREAIDQAADMLKRGEHCEAVLAVLEYLAHNDLMMGVREKAQEILNLEAKRGVPPSFRPGESRHIFGVRCKNGHITYFDKRRVCPGIGMVVRSTKQHSDKELDELHLKCEYPGCGLEVVARIDCRGYK